MESNLKPLMGGSPAEICPNDELVVKVPPGLARYTHLIDKFSPEFSRKITKFPKIKPIKPEDDSSDEKDATTHDDKTQFFPYFAHPTEGCIELRDHNGNPKVQQCFNQVSELQCKSGTILKVPQSSWKTVDKNGAIAVNSQGVRSLFASKLGQDHKEKLLFLCIDPEVHGKIDKGKQKRALELAQIVVTKTTVLLEEEHHIYVAKNVVGADNEIGSVSDRIFLTNYQMAQSNKDKISMTYELQDGNNEQSSLGGRIVLDGSQDIGMTQFQTACDLTFDIMIETEHCSVILERGNDPIGSPINADKICGAHPDEGIMDDLSYIGDEIATQFSKAIQSIDFNANAQSTTTTTTTTTGAATDQDGDTQVIQIDDATPATTPAPDTTSDTISDATPVEPAKTQARPVATHETQNAVLESKPKSIDPKKPKSIHDIRKFENKVLEFTLDTTYSGECCKIITPESDKIIIDKNFDETDNIAVVATSSAVLAVSDELLDSLGIKNVAFTLSREIPQSDLPRRKLEKTPIMFPPGIPIKMQEGIYHACISFTKKSPMKSVFNATTNTTEYIETNDNNNNDKMANHTCSGITYINLGGSHYVLSEVENYEKRAIKEEKMHLHMKDDKFSQIIDPNNMTNVIEFLKSNDLSQSTNGLDSLVQIMWETITKEIIDNYHEITSTDQKIAVASNNVNEKRYILDKLNKELLKEKDELYQADGVIAEDKSMKQDSDLDLTKANIKHENSEVLQKELAKIWHDLIAAERHEEHQRIGLHEQLELTKNTLDELQAKMKAQQMAGQQLVEDMEIQPLALP